MNFNCELDVDLNEVEEFVKSDKFAQFLLNNNVDLAVPVFVLQVLLEKIEELKEENKNG